MLKKRNRPIGSIPSKAKCIPLDSNKSLQQKAKHDMGGKNTMQSSTSNSILIKKIPFQKKNENNNAYINQKKIDNEINRLEMKMDQTEECLAKDSLFNNFQRESDNILMLRNIPHEEHINQIININIYNNMNETIKTCSVKNTTTEREDSFIQNISIDDIDIQSKQISINNYNQKNLENNIDISANEDNTGIEKETVVTAIKEGKENCNVEGKDENSIHNNVVSVSNHGMIKNNNDGKQMQNNNKTFFSYCNTFYKCIKKKTIITIGAVLLTGVIIIGVFIYIFHKTD